MRVTGISYMKSKIFSTCMLLVLSVSLGHAQVDFYDGTQEVLGVQEIRSTIAIAIDDINGDYKDDLILLDEGKYLKTFQQRGESAPFIYKSHSQTSSFGEWSIITGDLDNDGFPEVISSGNENGSEILFRTNGLYIAKQNTPALYSQNTNLVDLDLDGDLDLFVCNDTGENATYMNDGDGVMTKESIIDFKTSDEDDMSGNYSSLFTDIDNDGDLDLYIGKCRAGVEDPTDRRRVNTLYINQGDGTYIESAESFGLANGSQTWSVDGGDVDNDGDIDLIIANHDRTHDLMLNNGDGTFSRWGALPENIKSFAYQSFFADFDNNGWLDIFITEPSNSYILYNCEMSFSTRNNEAIGYKRAFSGAVGDFNSDGFTDIYMSYPNTFQTPGENPDVVYLNSKNSNNYLDISLKGTVSNRDAIGAKVEVYAGDLYQMREIKAGQSYGIMNSTIAHFGLANKEAVDSIVITWPTGEQYVSDNIDVNSKYIISEDGCQSRQLDLPDLELCDGLPVSVDLAGVYDEYIWSNGSSDSSIEISIPGSYSVKGIKDGCESVSNFFNVKAEIDHKSDEIIIPESLIGCNEQIVSLEAIHGLEYLWNTGETSQTLEVNTPGTYQVTVSTNCGMYESEELHVDYFYSVTPTITEDEVKIGETALLQMTGDNVRWFQYKSDEVSILLGNEYITDPLERDTFFYAGDLESGNTGYELLMPVVPLNIASDSMYAENDTLPFIIYQLIKLNSITVRTQRPGRRSIEIWTNGAMVWESSLFFESGTSEIAINQFFDKGDYIITTNADVNQDSLGLSHPAFSFSELYLEGDKTIEGYLKIGESVKNTGVTPYFFDWDISYGYYACDERYKVEALVDDQSSVTDISKFSSIYPNPSNGKVNIVADIKYPLTIDLYNLAGKKVTDSKVIYNKSEMLDLSQLISGVYVANITSGNQSWSEKLIIY